MLSNPIRASNNSQMLLGGAGISRSLREKTKGPRPAVMLITCCFYTVHSLVHVSGGCTWFAKCIPCLQCLCRKGERTPAVLCFFFLLMALKMTILSDLLINCLPAVTTANIQPSTVSVCLCRALTKC